MPNNFDLTNLTEIIYAARDQVARELVGFLPSVIVNGGSERVSIGGTVESLRSVKPVLNTSFTPAMTIPAGDDVKPEKDFMTIGQVANVKIPFTGEAALKLDNTAGRQSLQDTFAQSLRVMVNAIEAHTGVIIKNGASRAIGTAGTTPFATDHKLLNSVGQILRDNGCPQQDGQLVFVMDTNAGTNFRNLTNLYKVNESGDDSLLRQGTLGEIAGFKMKESAGVAVHTKGTGASATTSNAGFAKDVNLLALAAAGTGTILPGDVINIATENNGINYVVNSGDVDVSNGGSITIGQPGLRTAIATSARAITVGNNYTANLGFHRSAIEVVMRPPAMPGKDAAVDRITMFDPRSGLSFDVALYLGYGMVMYDITCFYQAKVWKPEFVATLMG